MGLDRYLQEKLGRTPILGFLEGVTNTSGPTNHFKEELRYPICSTSLTSSFLVINPHILSSRIKVLVHSQILKASVVTANHSAARVGGQH